MSIFRSSLFFSMGTILSRLSGLLREAVLAGIFGASVFFDAFLVAYRIPNLLRDMLAEGALSGAFTRVYTAAYEESPQDATTLFYDSLRVFLGLATVVVALGVLFAPQLVSMMTLFGDYGDTVDFFNNAVLLTKLLFPFILFPILASLSMGVLHRHGGFFITGFSPVFLNIGFIIGGTVLARHYDWSRWFGAEVGINNNGVIGLAVGVLLGGLSQFAFQFVFAVKRVFGPMKFSKVIITPQLKKVFILMAPAAIAASAGPITAFVNTNFATSVGEGAVSWLYFAFRLLQLPVGVFGVAIGMAALPSLTRSITQAGGRVDEKTSHQLQSCVQMVFWIMVPAALFLNYAAYDLITLFFKHLRFLAADRDATVAALQAYSFGVVGYGLIKVMTSYYFSVERTRFAMMVSLLGICITIIINLMLIKGYGHVGLAMAASTTLSLNALVLLLGTKKDNLAWDMSRITKVSLAIVLAALIFVAADRSLFAYLPSAIFEHEKLNALANIVIHGGLLVAIYAPAILWVEKKTPLQLLRSV